MLKKFYVLFFANSSTRSSIHLQRENRRFSDSVSNLNGRARTLEEVLMQKGIIFIISSSYILIGSKSCFSLYIFLLINIPFMKSNSYKHLTNVTGHNCSIYKKLLLKLGRPNNKHCWILEKIFFPLFCLNILFDIDFESFFSFYEFFAVWKNLLIFISHLDIKKLYVPK